MITSLTSTSAGLLSRTLRSPLVIVLAASALMLVVGEYLRPGFSQPGQLVTLLRISAFLGFIAAGQTLIILSGNDGIDLSVGSVVTAAAVIVYSLNGTLGLPFALLAAVAAGALVGLVNGMGVTLVGLPPLIMTLGMAGVVNGLVLVLTDGRPMGSEVRLLTDFVTKSWVAGIPGAVFLWLLLAVALHFLLSRTAWGRGVYAIGANIRAARLSGLRTTGYRITVYVIASALAAVGGIVLLGYTGTVFLNLGEPYTLPSVAAVVIGGTLLAGGIGSYWGTVAGAIMLTVLQSLLIALGLPEFGRQIVYGALLALTLCVYSRASG